MELEDRVYRLKELFKNCMLCPRACRVDRTQGVLGYCRLPAEIIMDCALAHHGEEPPLSGENGAGTIFFLPAIWVAFTVRIIKYRIAPWAGN